MHAEPAEGRRVRAVVLTLLTRGAERGELRVGADLEAATDHLFGLFWYRLLVGHQPLTADEAPAHVAQLLQGLGGPEGR
jgi:hypothetical protein